MRSFSFSSLRVRLLLLVLLAVIPAFGLILYAARDQRSAAADSAKQEALKLARDTVQQQLQVVSEARRYLGQLAQRPEVDISKPRICSAFLASELKKNRRYTNIAAADMDGNVLCTGLPHKRGVSVADRSHFQKTLKTRDFSVGNYQIGRTTGKATIGFAYPDFDTKGNFQAIVLATLDLSWLNEVLAKINKPAQADTLLTIIDQNGVILARSLEAEKWVGKAMPQHRIVRAILSQRGEGTVEDTGIDGVHRLYAFAPFLISGDAPAYVSIGISTEVAYANVKRTLLLQLLLLGIITALILAIAWVGSDRLMLRQVNALVDTASRVAAGDLSTRTGLSYRKGELGQLAQSFDAMGEALEAREADLRRSKEVLQQNFQRVRALREIDMAIMSTLDLRSVIDVLLEKIDLFLPYAVTTVRLLNRETGELESFACKNVDEKEWKEATAKSRGGIARMLPQDNSPVIVRNAQTDPRSLSSEFVREHGLVSFLRVPLTAKGEVLGVLTFFTKQDHEFTNDEVEFLTTLAGQAAIAIFNAKLYDQTERHLKRIEALREIDKAINSTLDLHTVLDLLLEKIDVFLPFPASTTIRLFNRAIGKFENTTCRNIDERLWKVQVGQGTGNLSQGILRTKAPVMVHDIQMDKQRKAGEFYRRHGFVSYLGVPLIAKEEIVGILGFYTKTAHEFTQQEIDFLLTLAGQAAIAIHNSQLYEKIRLSNAELEKTTRYLGRSLKQLGGLYTALTPIAPASSTEEMMDGIVERIVDATGADAALIRVWDKNADGYPIIAQRGFPDDYRKRVISASRGGAVNWVIKHGEAIIAPDIASDSRLKGKAQVELGIRSCALLPLTVHEEVRGVIHVSSRKSGYFDDQQKDHLLAIARQMSSTLENRELFYNLKSSKDELERANKVKDQFLSVISHELRTPLNLIMGYAGTIKEGMFGGLNPGQEKALEKVLNHSKGLLSMITNILYATRIEANEVRIESHRFALTDFLTDLRSTYDMLQEQQVSVVWDYPFDLPAVETDREKLKQILQNLIHNAIKFTDSGQVTISARIKESSGSDQQLENGWIEFKVADTGSGISEEKLPMVFEMFRQADSSETRLHGGMGLGLYIAKHFTELLRGTIEVETAVNKGCTFIVSLPCVFRRSSENAAGENRAFESLTGQEATQVSSLAFNLQHENHEER